MRFAADYAATHWCQEGVDQPGESMQITGHDAWFRVPIVQDERREFSARAHVGLWDIDTGAALPDRGVDFPGELWDVDFGATYRWKLDDDWIAGIDGAIGSASDEPFHSCDEVTANATGWLMIPSGEGNAWLLFLNYSNTREFLPHVPLPGAAYSWRANPRLHWIVGFPFTRIALESLIRSYCFFAAGSVSIRFRRAAASSFVQIRNGWSTSRTPAGADAARASRLTTAMRPVMVRSLRG
jgi:hypothetical protein